MDEAAVRAGTCQFYVKYLGAIEVFESRGMQVVYINSVQGRSEGMFFGGAIATTLSAPMCSTYPKRPFDGRKQAYQRGSWYPAL